jgi:topoisomerase (DNA) II binding protein 1
VEKSADARETKVAKSSCGIFHVPTVNDSHGKELEKNMLSERKPARGKHGNMNRTQATRSAKSSQQNGMVSIGEYHPSAQVTSEMNSGSTKSTYIFKGKTFGFSNSFSHNKVCWFTNISSVSCIGIDSFFVPPLFFNNKKEIL